MAQVNMSGIEYAALLDADRKITNLLTQLKGDRHPRFTEESLKSFGVGEWRDTVHYPDWLTEELVADMAQWLLHLSETEFAVWIKSGMWFYNPWERNFYTTAWGAKARDMRQAYEPLAARITQYLKKKEAESSEE